MTEYRAPYAPETCDRPGHVPGCAGAAGGNHEYVKVRLNAMRCTECGHRVDDMNGCDSCAADRESAEMEHETGHDESVEGCSFCENRDERGAAMWERTSASY